MMKIWQRSEKRAWEEAKCLVHKEAAKKVQEEAEQKAQEEAERKAEEEHKAQEEAARVKEEAERVAKEAAVREEAVRRVVEAVEERADAERRAVKEQLWEAVGQRSETAVAPLWVAKPSGRMTVAGPSAPAWRASRVQDPCTRCCNKGTFCILGAAKGKAMACEVCCHAKVSCSWSKKMAGEMRKQKQAWRSEEVEETEIINMDKDEDKDWPHFVRVNNLKEEEMGRSKGKGKEKAQEEFRRARTEDDDGDTEMGRAGPSSLA
ncbi:hypothetical protein ID866_11858 [Astraeus odoratus]|nr:hypothetical protein ID866_11858 [Astraeus odoratus]